MKKEVIYFDACAFGPNVQCIMINGYLESCFIRMDDETLDGRKKIKLDESKILHFWKRIDELNVWNWKKRYDDEMAMTDGFTWVVKLRNRDGKSKYSTGYEKYPKTFKKFVNELNILFKIKIDFWD